MPLHMGIAVVQSLDIGAFLPNLGTYLLGFGAADATPGSAGWWCALGISAAGAVPLALRRRLVAEDWPLSPFALFAFSGRQWDALFTHLDLLPGVADRRTRLVLGPAAMASPVGCAVVGRLSSGGSNDSDGAKVVYNGWEQVIGETLVFNEVLDGVDFDLLCKDAATAAATSAALPCGRPGWRRRRRRVRRRPAAHAAARRASAPRVGGGARGRLRRRFCGARVGPPAW